jgi:DNA-binding LacI/PurR family transcriptional regulator
MREHQILSAAEQVARQLREQIAQGVFKGTMPGGAVLARKFGIGRTTADAALDILETEGIIKSKGARRRREILRSERILAQREMSVGLILYEPEDAANLHVTNLRQQLLPLGFRMAPAPHTLVELKHKPWRIEKMIHAHPADAWIIVAGSEPVLRWFSESPIPAFALFGRMKNLPIPGIKPDKQPAMTDALKTLAALGHHRIVLLVREDRRIPSYGFFEEAFLEQLQSLGIPTGTFYNIPNWHESASGLRSCLERLMKNTPPTVIFVGDAVLFLAVQNVLRSMNTVGANQITLISTDHHPAFDWCDPAIPHISWNHRAIVREMVNWLKNLRRGKPTYKQTFVPTTFVEGSLGRQPQVRN